ncbi:MAG TPA: hypothetical protein VJK54_04820 [Chthoniobacterales bacterium]|nr:hypothetical protein [Chthoniobacterales bacterium]
MILLRIINLTRKITLPVIPLLLLFFLFKTGVLFANNDSNFLEEKDRSDLMMMEMNPKVVQEMGGFLEEELDQIFHANLLLKQGKPMDATLDSSLGLDSMQTYSPAPKPSSAWAHQSSQLSRYDQCEISRLALNQGNVFNSHRMNVNPSREFQSSFNEETPLLIFANKNPAITIDQDSAAVQQRAQLRRELRERLPHASDAVIDAEIEARLAFDIAHIATKEACEAIKIAWAPDASQEAKDKAALLVLRAKKAGHVAMAAGSTAAVADALALAEKQGFKYPMPSPESMKARDSIAEAIAREAAQRAVVRHSHNGDNFSARIRNYFNPIASHTVPLESELEATESTPLILREEINHKRTQRNTKNVQKSKE